MWNLSSPTKDRTHAPCFGSAVLTTGLLGKSQEGDALKVKKWSSLSFDHGPPSWGVRGPSGVRGLTSDEVLASGILAEQWSIGK